jgi:hypothetical protein
MLQASVHHTAVKVFKDTNNNKLKNSILINPLNTQLNPICHLLTLLGTHPILHIIRIGVNSMNLNPTIEGLINLTRRQISVKGYRILPPH